MSTISKQYTFLDKITVDASEINRNFDDLYTTINSLNSENLGSYSPAASQVTIADTASNYTSTELEVALSEPTYLQKGHHTIHVIPQGSNALIVYPGEIEIGGRICTVDTKFTFSGVVQIDSGAFAIASSYYLVCGQPLTGITASDIYLIETSSITTSASYADGGYYYDNKRLIGAVYANVGAGQAFTNYYNPDPVKKPFNVFVNSSGLESLFAITQPIGITTGTYINEMSIMYNQDVGAYGYRANIRLSTGTDTALFNFGGGGVRSSYTWDMNSRTSFFSSTAITLRNGQTTISIQVTEARAVTEFTEIVATPVTYLNGNA